MAPGTDAQRPHAPPHAGGSWWPPGLAVGAVAVLVTAWPLLDRVLPGTEPVRSGHALAVGSSEDVEAELTFRRDGWALRTGTSTAERVYHFSRGPAELTLSTVTPTTAVPPTAPELWRGLDRTLRAGDGSTRLGPPDPTRAEDGTRGLTGTLTSDTESGTAVLYPSPDGRFAVSMTLTGRDATRADLADVDDVLTSITFTREDA
ncbi:hypothetical protein [Nocardiopsis sp. NRRL B-16309]|uniref:hypothetical protein n=1 Tax=Nocardiopsis sp. NRRL B-16309 TaxID=1519494 RepID=UPI0006AFE4C1|nr:hypothetical protein [Nocardiopsis sp. NRRL B-16309]KOX12413.1 hypothetical protein ADL05_21170 [Nocardiopsis sp. NRRL B-16309]